MNDNVNHVWPLLSSVSDDNGNALLVITRVSDGSGRIASISDRYGRSVYYHIGRYFNTSIVAGWPQSYEEVDRVSQIGATGGQPVDRYEYGYQEVANGEGSEQVNFLHTITMPSATGQGTSTATINYDPHTSLVSSVVDGNGNTHTYESVDSSAIVPIRARGAAPALQMRIRPMDAVAAGGAPPPGPTGNPSYPSSYSQVIVTDSGGNVIYTYQAGYDNNMSGSVETNGAGQPQYTKTFGDPNDPYRPSSVIDGNGNTTTYSWDGFGNLLSSTDARGVTTTYTWNYSNFALGELTGIQQTNAAGQSKTATTIAYAEPTGLPTQINSPTPGTAGTGSTAATTIAYDSYGNPVTVTTPGNGTVSSKTTTLNYASDGTYSQAVAIDEPLAITDNLGNVTHFRYDARGNRTVVVDALGNETDQAYNLADQPTVTTLPATGQTGTGHANSVNSYQYVGGPLQSTAVLDESGNRPGRRVIPTAPKARRSASAAARNQ